MPAPCRSQAARFFAGAVQPVAVCRGGDTDAAGGSPACFFRAAGIRRRRPRGGNIFHLMKRDRHAFPRMIRSGTGPCGPAARLCARISWRGGFSSGIARADFLPCAPPEPDPAWENLSAPASRSGRAALFGIGMRSSAFHPVFIRSLPAEALKL